ncbi:MAG: nucleotide exchange factor GrpE [Methanobacteriota archaeon]
MDDAGIPDIQKKAEIYESQYHALKKEFKEFIETTRKNEDLKRKEIQSDQAKKLLVLADSLCRMTDTGISPPCDHVRDVQDSYIQNIGAMYQQLLSSSGLTPIDPAPGCSFDDTIHMAIGLEYGSRYPENTIFSVIRRGYMRDTILIRPAEVIISKKPRSDGTRKKPGIFNDFIRKFFPPRLTTDFLVQQIDHLEHERSQTTIRLEEEIRILQEGLTGQTHEREELGQIISDQAEMIERLEEEIDQMKQSLSQSATGMREIITHIQVQDDRLNAIEDMVHTEEIDTYDDSSDERI